VKEEREITYAAVDYALGHSLAFRPKDLATTSSVHGPFALYPSPFPRQCFTQAQEIQVLYNQLYASLASDEEFLELVIGGAVAKVDAFQGGLWKIWQHVKDEGVAQDLVLGLFRSDYMLHSSSSPSEEGAAAQFSIRQVEFNTISSSFGPSATKITNLHRYLAASQFYPSLDGKVSLANLPINPALTELAAGLAAGHKAYGVKEQVDAYCTIRSPRLTPLII